MFPVDTDTDTRETLLARFVAAASWLRLHPDSVHAWRCLMDVLNRAEHLDAVARQENETAPESDPGPPR